MRVSYLIGRKGFFFEPDNGGNLSGAPSQSANGGDATSNQQQQQQQNQSTEFISPFKGIDLNLVDDVAREAITKAEANMRDLHGRAAQASKYQSERDQAAAQNQTLTETLQSLQKQNGRGPNGANDKSDFPLQNAPSLEDELEQILVEGGMTHESAKKTAQIQARMQGVLASRIEGRIGQRFAPVVGNVIEANVTSAFEQVQQNDPLGILSTPEISERVWLRAKEIANEGTLITPAVVQNLARIYYIEHLEANGGQPPNIRMNPPAPPQQQQQSTRFSYPGAGAHARMPQANNGGNQNEALDPETFAALAATTDRWPVQPERFKGKGSNGKVHVTRGYQS